MKSKKSIFALALCGIVAICASVIGATAAWFTAKDSATGTVSTGTLTVALTNQSGADMNTITGGSNLAPGAQISEAVYAKVTTTLTGGAYLRVKVVSTNEGIASVAVDTSAWTKDGDYYYYGKANAIEGTNKLTAVTAATPIKICDAIEISESLNNTNQGITGVTVTFTLEAIQAENLDDADDLSAAWAAVATQDNYTAKAN